MKTMNISFTCDCVLGIIESSQLSLINYGVSWKYILTRETFLFTDHDEVGTIEINKHDPMMEVISTRRYEARPPARTHPGILVNSFL